MDKANEAVVIAHLAALARGDVAVAMESYTEGGVLHYPGRNKLTGHHKGKPAVTSFLGKAMELTNGTFHPDVRDILSNDQLVVLLVGCRAQRDGKSFEWSAVDVYAVQNGKIAEHWVYESDQHIVDEVFR